MLGHLARMPDERLLKLLTAALSAVWTYGWLWSYRQESEAIGALCQGRPAGYRAFIHMVEEIPRQVRL